MKKTKNIAINGFGRIGRAAFKAALNNKKLKIVAINDLTDTPTLAHLLKYDSVYGKFNTKISYQNNKLIVANQKIPVFSHQEPNKLPWKKLGIEVVLECTGIFREYNTAKLHLKAGAKKVIISAPPKSDDIKNIVLGVNFNDYHAEQDHIIACASCTTNCLAPMVKVINDNFKIKQGLATTIHSYTADQNLVDGPHQDLRRARAAAVNIVPTSTGSAIAVTKVIPELIGRLDAIAYRVPTACASIVELVAEVQKSATIAKINQSFKRASNKELTGILDVNEDELVSSDYIGNPHSAVIDLKLTNVIGDNLIKVVGWYDNELGYSHRLVELAELI